MKLRNSIYQAWVIIKGFSLYSIINILGLALSLGCVMLLAKYAHRELTVDNFHAKSNTTYALVRNDENGSFLDMLVDYYALLTEQEETIDFSDYPEVKNFVRVSSDMNEITVDNNRRFNAQVINVDTSFYSVFDFPLSVGDKSTVLLDPHNAVIKRSFAEKVFGKERNPIGEKIEFSGGMFTIAGIAEDIPQKSMIEYDVIVPRPLGNVSFYRGAATFYVIDSPESVEELNAKIENCHFFYPNDISLRPKNEPQMLSYKLVPMREVYNDTNISKLALGTASGDMHKLGILLLVAALVFAVGVFNFVNIQSVTTLKRGKELGVKKVFGADGGFMFRQFVCENVLMVFIATVLGFVFSEIVRVPLNRLSGMGITDLWSFDLLLFVAIMVVIPVVVSLIPYFRFRYSMPVTAIKQVSFGGGRRNIRLVFVVGQYVITIVMIVVSMLFVKQLHYMLDYDKGFRTDRIIVAESAMKEQVIDTGNYDDSKRMQKERRINGRALMDELNAAPFIENWAMNYDQFISSESQTTNVKGSGQFHTVQYINSPWSLPEIFGLKFIEGKTFPEDSDFKSNYIILTRSAAELLGIDDMAVQTVECETPRWISFNSEIGEVESNTVYKIVGIIEDIYPNNLSKSTYPYLIMCNEQTISGQLFVRYAEGAEQQTLEFLREQYAKISGTEFEYTTAENQIAELYADDSRVATIYSIFAVIAILISSLGLFGLSYFDVQQRYREIAIRKINGATIREILSLLSAKYYGLLVAAFVVACPLAWWFVTGYLKNYAVKAPLSWWIFLVAGVFTAVVSLATLWWQTSRAANANPADSIKRE